MSDYPLSSLANMSNMFDSQPRWRPKLDRGYRSTSDLGVPYTISSVSQQSNTGAAGCDIDHGGMMSFHEPSMSCAVMTFKSEPLAMIGDSEMQFNNSLQVIF